MRDNIALDTRSNIEIVVIEIQNTPISQGFFAHRIHTKLRA
jgi:hypothetical protein